MNFFLRIVAVLAFAFLGGASYARDAAFVAPDIVINDPPPVPVAPAASSAPVAAPPAPLAPAVIPPAPASPAPVNPVPVAASVPAEAPVSPPPQPEVKPAADTPKVVEVGNKTGGLVAAGDVKPVDFGKVAVGQGKVVRSTLMVNDSAEPITLYSIDLIEADNGLQKIDQGCAVNMELGAGASCPVTLVWMPKTGGQVSTDLIIRHSGRPGFTVIPVRGSAEGDGSASMLPVLSESKNKSATKAVRHALPNKETNRLYLIGTVGDRALFQKPDGETVVVSEGNRFDFGKMVVKLVAVTTHSATVIIDGQRRNYVLESAPAAAAKKMQNVKPGAESGGK